MNQIELIELCKLIREFAALHPEFGDQDTAWGQCDRASDLFIRFAHAKGYTGRLMLYTFYADADDSRRWAEGTSLMNPAPDVYRVYDASHNVLKNESGVTVCMWHAIVDAGDILIDFTARQYSTSFAFPYIIEAKSKTAKAGV
jgi:hypothetical protein